MWEELKVESLLHVERSQLRWWRPGTQWRGYVSQLAWEHLGILPTDLGQVVGDVCLSLSTEAAKPNPIR